MDRFVTLAIEDWCMPGNEPIELIGRVIERSFYEECVSAEFDRELVVKGGI